jgi:hypothetical protein
MRFALVFLFALSSSGAISQDRLGKSQVEIVGMGLEKWVEFYTSQKGHSEADVNAAHHVFAACQKAENESAIAALQQPDRDRLTKYKALYVPFREQAIKLASLYAGGGTMYTHFLSRGPAYDEELMAALIKLNTRPIDFATVENLMKIRDLYGQVSKELGERSTITIARRKEMEAIGIDWKTILSTGQAMMRNLDRMSPLLPRERQQECLLVFEFYLRYVRLSESDD